MRTVEVFNDQGEAQQLKLFPSHVAVPSDDPQVARVLVNRVRLERTRQFGACYVGLQLWKRLELDRFFEQAVDDDSADVSWSRVAALLAINRLCAPGSELAIEERWYPSTALDDLLAIEEDKINDTRLYRCLDRILPHKTKLERHLKQRYGELFEAEFDVLLYDLTSTYVEGAAEKNPMILRAAPAPSRPAAVRLRIASSGCGACPLRTFPCAWCCCRAAARWPGRPTWMGTVPRNGCWNRRKCAPFSPGRMAADGWNSRGRTPT